MITPDASSAADALFFARLRRPATVNTVAGSLPVLFFGDWSHARVATIGINPSRCEYLTDAGVELDGPSRRFETLASLGAIDRAALTDAECRRAIERMTRYFDSDAAAYWRWFRPLERVLAGWGTSLIDRSTTHLDLVQEATDPVWGSIVDRAERDGLLLADAPFLRAQIAESQIADLLCTSAKVGESVRSLLGVNVRAEGLVAESRMKWWAGVADLEGRAVRVAGWNYPLARPHGLNAAGLARLGELLRTQMGS